MTRYRFRRGTVLPLLALLTACGVQATQAPAPVPPQVPSPTATLMVTPTVLATLAPTPTPTATATALPTATMVEEQTTLPQLSLSVENAPPLPMEVVTEPVKSFQPARIIIPAINLDLKTKAVGLDARRVPIVPKHEPGWFTNSAVPGQGTNIVIWGHVLRWQDAPTVPAPFARIEELKPGATVEVVTADGKAWSYRVTQQLRVRPEDVHFISPTLTERLTLVSCIGDKVIRDGTLTKAFRLVTVAEPLR